MWEYITKNIFLSRNVSSLHYSQNVQSLKEQQAKMLLSLPRQDDIRSEHLEDGLTTTVYSKVTSDRHKMKGSRHMKLPWIHVVETKYNSNRIRKHQSGLRNTNENKNDTELKTSKVIKLFFQAVTMKLDVTGGILLHVVRCWTGQAGQPLVKSPANLNHYLIFYAWWHVWQTN